MKDSASDLSVSNQIEMGTVRARVWWGVRFTKETDVIGNTHIHTHAYIKDTVSSLSAARP